MEGKSFREGEKLQYRSTKDGIDVAAPYGVHTPGTRNCTLEWAVPPKRP